MAGMFRGVTVFLRSEIRQLHTKTQWRKELRRVKDSELAI